MNAHSFSPTQLLEELRGRGVMLTAIGDRLRYDAPAGAIGDLLPDLVKFKPALLELLLPDVAQAVATAENNVVQYVRTRSAGYFAQQRAHAEIARCLNEDDKTELSRLLAKLDAGEGIEI